MKRKGIILAGGTGSRLHPSTIAVSKQLMPVFDKPMIYYPLSVLMQAGLREIMIITTPHDAPAFKRLLGDGKRWGIEFTYAEQPSPDGLAQALIIAEDFLEGGPSVLILGDNLFFGHAFNKALQSAVAQEVGATIFGFQVNNPSDYGVVNFDQNNRPLSIEEKPKKPKSNYAVTGLYFYDGDAPSMAKQVKPSQRGELEITSLNSLYLEAGKLRVELVGSDAAWLDTGTHRSLLQAAQFVSVMEERQGLRICCPEEIAYQQAWIDPSQLRALAAPLEKSGYGKYLIRLIGNT